MRGKSYNGQPLPFGERAHFRILTDDKYEDRWIPGVFVGKLVETDEFILLTDKGISKSRSRTMPTATTWNCFLTSKGYLGTLQVVS